MLSLFLGMFSLVLALQYSQYQLTYDDWISDSGQTFAVRTTITPPGGEPVLTASSPVGLPQWLDNQRLEDFQDLAYFRHRPVHILPDNIFIAEQLTEVSPGFLSVFKLQDDERPLMENEVLLSRAAAIRAYGRPDVTGEDYEIPNIGTYQVRGVFEMPQKSHLKFDVLVARPVESMQETRELGDWTSLDEFVYVRLGKSRDAKTVERILNEALPDYLGPIVVRGTSLDASAIWDISLTRVGDMNFLPPMLGQMKAPAHDFEIYFVFFLIVFVFVIMLSNLFNLAFLSVEDRAVEFRMRQLHGETPLHQASMLFLEMLLLTLLMLAVALLAVYAAGPYFEQAWSMPKIWTIALTDPSWARTIAIGLATALIIPLILVLQTFYPGIVRKKNEDGKNGSVARGVLLFMQVFAAGLVVTATIVLSQELNRQVSVNPGFDPNSMMMIRDAQSNSGFTEMLDDIRAALLEADGVTDAVYSNSVPGQPFPSRTIVADADRPDGPTAMSAYHSVSTTMLERFGASLLAGRFFDPDRADDRFADHEGVPISAEGAVIVNRALIEAFGFASGQDALGQRLDLGDGRIARIIGVIENWPYQGINRDTLPTVMVEDVQAFAHLFIFGRDNLPAIQDALGQTVPTLNAHMEPFGPFWAQQFVTLKRATELGFFLSIIVMSLVLVGLVSYLDFFIRKRTVELLIHQLHGAGLSQLFVIAGRVILVAVALGSLASLGFSYYLVPYAAKSGFAGSGFGAMPVMSIALIAIVILGIGWVSALRILLRRDLYQALRSE